MLAFFIVLTLTFIGCGERNSKREKKHIQQLNAKRNALVAAIGPLAARGNPGEIEDACYFGNSLAFLHYALGKVDENHQLVRNLQKTVNKKADEIGITIPNEELGRTYDPRVKDIAEKITSAKSVLERYFFEFSYHATRAGHHADSIVNPTKSKSGLINFKSLTALDELSTKVHTDLAVRAVAKLKLPQKVLKEGISIIEAMDMINKLPSEERPKAYQQQQIRDRLSTWASGVKVGVPFELRLYLPSKKK